jgi:hypothetical protein
LNVERQQHESDKTPCIHNTTAVKSACAMSTLLFHILIN